MSHYRSQLSDTLFTLFDVLRVQEHWDAEAFPDWDAEIAADVLSEVETFSREVLAASYEDSDRNPPLYDPASRTVTMPASFKETFRQYQESGWWNLDLPRHMGGGEAPPSVRWAAAEFLLGANPAAYMYMAGPGFASVLDQLGNDEQKRLAALMVERGWGATMVLTEPDAGSDVGAARTKAYPQDDGSWRIEGVKRFITSAEHDMTENIIHLVLARPVGDNGETRPGTKGLSLFVVPKFHVDLNMGNIGDRNGVYATNVEKKMGLKASTTCELTFTDQGVPAVGWLVGDTHDGIAQMFTIIEYARMMVGTKAMSQLSAGHQLAVEYAQSRMQGPDLTDILDKTAPRVPISNHPDVRRMLMEQKMYAEGLRALVLYTAMWQDQMRSQDGSDVSLASKVNDLLLPIVKGVCSEKAYELLSSSLQVLGGSGYLQDYPVEQYIRDAKIDTLYEGTTSIQGMDLFFRKMMRDGFVAYRHLAEEIRGSEFSHFGAEQEKLAAAVDAVDRLVAAAADWAGQSLQERTSIYKVGLVTTNLLMMLGDVLVGWLLLRAAQVAVDTSRGDAKAAAARWFAHTRLAALPGTVAALHDSVELVGLELMDVPADDL